ncbi:MAG: DNA polymerase III subunit alpha [Dehalococcoidia bacterium]
MTILYNSAFGATPMQNLPPERPAINDASTDSEEVRRPQVWSDYVELHSHSAFSFLEGAAHPDELVLQAKLMGYPALALTDHDGLHGAMEFARIARANDVKPITGAELTLEGGYHLTILAETTAGYHNLCRLISYAHMANERGNPVTKLDDLQRHSTGLIALSGCKKGEVPKLLAEGDYKGASQAAQRFKDWFGPNNFWIELQHNLVFGDAKRVTDLAALADELGLGYVATNNAHYHVRERHQLQDVMVAIKNRSTLDASHRLRRENSEYFLKSGAEMAELFADYPQAIANTLVIAERIQFDLTHDLDYTFPDYPVPEGYDPDSWLERVCYEAAARRYSGNFRPGGADERPARGRYVDASNKPDSPAPKRNNRRPPLPTLPPVVDERLRDELRLVKKHGLAGFFLIYKDLMNMAREVADSVRDKHRWQYSDQLPPGRGRGSSVGSIICYLIGLSHVDPLQHNLFVGRFLNEELRSVPDIDLDFARDIREELILAVYRRFGHEHAALVCTYPTYRTKSAIRDVGKALGLPLPELDKLAKLSEHYSSKEVFEEMSLYPEFRPKINAPLWRDLVRLAYEIAGMPRHVSQHVGGMIVSSRPMIELVPVEKARMPGRVVCQWDKDGVDDAGFIKIDFLALGMLSLVDEALELIEEHRGRRVDLSRIDFQDEKVFDDICAGDTVGVFQIESRAQIQTLPRTRPRTIEDLTVEVAIIRPGPIVGGAVNPYIKRRQGREPVTYDHPSLEECLKETLGVILFQEQVLQVAMALAGFSSGQAESLRRAMSRKRSKDAMVALWEQFREGCAERGVSEETATTVFEKLMGFAEFGFPKSHAAAFGLLAYQSAWLKRYYPAEFYCALFNAQPMGFYPPHVLTNDAKRHGVEVLRPDINKSLWRCTVEGDSLRLGLGYVQSIGQQYEQRLDEEGGNGEYTSIGDFCRRTGLRREAVENLIAVGAFDSFGLNRRELMWHLGLIYPQIASIPKEPAGKPARPIRGAARPLVIRDGDGSLQNPYYGWPLSSDQEEKAARSQKRYARSKQLPLPLPTEQDMVKLRQMNPWERLVVDYNLLHLSPDNHPMKALRPLLNEGIASSKHIEAMADESIAEMVGLVVTRQRPATAAGFIFLLLEDEFGLVNVVVKPDVFEKARQSVRMEPFLLVRGEVQHKDDTINLVAHEIRPVLVKEQPLSPTARSWA